MITFGTPARHRCTTCRLPLAAALALLALLGGCVGKPSNPSATQPATALDPKTAQPDYWLAQPATQAIAHDDFQELWIAARRAVQADSFLIDRVDYRGGVMTTYPLVSKQFFEVWRQDVQSPRDGAESSLATVRRTVRFDFTRLEDGKFECVPKVIVERYVATEHRITSVTQYRDIFSFRVATADPNQEQAFAGPADYWYAIRRDANLERQLAQSIRGELRSLH